MRLHFIIHEQFEAPGAYEIWAYRNAFNITYSRVYLGEKLPTSIDDIDFLIVMGGPQNPSTSLEECPHFNSKAEQVLISEACTRNKIVIGVCLGSQLIGESFGAKYEHSPEKEIGKFPITLTKEGLFDPHFSHFGETTEVGHWHSDMPGLTNDSVIIAFSEGCPRQIVKYKKFVYGFQCHLELTPDVVKLLIENSTEELTHSVECKFVDSSDLLLQHDYREMNEKLYDFLDKLKQDYEQSL